MAQDKAIGQRLKKAFAHVAHWHLVQGDVAKGSIKMNCLHVKSRTSSTGNIVALTRSAWLTGGNLIQRYRDREIQRYTTQSVNTGYTHVSCSEEKNVI